MYLRRTLPDGNKGSAPGEASQSTVPWGLYGGEAYRDANSNKARRESGDCLERQAKTTSAFCKVRFCFFEKDGSMGRGSRHGLHRDEWEQRRTEFVRRGLELPQAKLMPLDVAEIRSAARQRQSLRSYIASNLSNAALAKKFGVHERTIEKILSRETWSQEI